MKANKEILAELRKVNENLLQTRKELVAWKKADVDSHYNRDKEINHKLSVVLDMMVSFMQVFHPKVSQEQEEGELTQKANGIVS